jgi:hypothetical protein
LKIETFNKEIRDFFYNEKSKKVCKTIITSNTQSLCKAAKIAKYGNVLHIPKIFDKNSQEIPIDSLQDKVASSLNEKIKNLRKC